MVFCRGLMPIDSRSFVLVRNGISSFSTGINAEIGSFRYVGLLKKNKKIVFVMIGIQFTQFNRDFTHILPYL